MIPQEILERIINNLGKDGDKAYADLYDYSREVVNAKDKDGLSLLFHAIRMNDGFNISYLLKLGADINASIKDNHSMTCYEYAKENANFGGRPSYAFDAIESFKKIKENLKMEILLDNMLNPKDSKILYENAKNKQDNELVSLYHGAKTGNINEKVINWQKEILSTSNCIKEICGPTLSIKPLGLYWEGLGYEIQVPRGQIKFPGEEKENALIEINELGIALINNPERSIKFDEYKSKFLISMRVFQTSSLVDPPYGTSDSPKGQYDTKIVIDDSTMKGLNELQSMMEANLAKVLKNEQKGNSLTNMEKIRAKSLNQNPATNNLKFN